LIEFNAAQCAWMREAERTAEPLDVILLDERSQIVGGLFSTTQWGWLQIGTLWVDEALRGHGYGTRLMAEAEAEAKRCGCAHSRVGTFSLQAKGFYERLGYQVVGQLEEYPPGHTDYLMRTALDGQGAGNDVAGVLT
jgi:ribosomal protein S18 acetylase RimI-like enzyme